MTNQQKLQEKYDQLVSSLEGKITFNVKTLSPFESFLKDEIVKALTAQNLIPEYQDTNPVLTVQMGQREPSKGIYILTHCKLTIVISMERSVNEVVSIITNYVEKFF